MGRYVQQPGRREGGRQAGTRLTQRPQHWRISAQAEQPVSGLKGRAPLSSLLGKNQGQLLRCERETWPTRAVYNDTDITLYCEHWAVLLDPKNMCRHCYCCCCCCCRCCCCWGDPYSWRELPEIHFRHVRCCQQGLRMRRERERGT